MASAASRARSNTASTPSPRVLTTRPWCNAQASPINWVSRVTTRVARSLPRASKAEVLPVRSAKMTDRIVAMVSSTGAPA